MTKEHGMEWKAPRRAIVIGAGIGLAVGVIACLIWAVIRYLTMALNRQLGD